MLTIVSGCRGSPPDGGAVWLGFRVRVRIRYVFTQRVLIFFWRRWRRGQLHCFESVLQLNRKPCIGIIWFLTGLLGVVLRVCVCVCVWEREREREAVCIWETMDWCKQTFWCMNTRRCSMTHMRSFTSFDRSISPLMIFINSRASCCASLEVSLILHHVSKKL